MSELLAQTPEVQERCSPTALWMSGTLEVSGSVGFNAPSEKGKIYPVIQITDKDEEYIKGIAERFGGMVKPRGLSYRWAAFGNDCIRIARECAETSPSRREMFEQFLEWSTAENPADQFDIARRFPTSHRTPATVDEYTALLASDAFLKGVVDARGKVGVYQRNHGRTNTEWRFDLPSQNIELLEALRCEFGGRIVTRSSKDSFGKSMVFALNSREAIEEITRRSL